MRCVHSVLGCGPPSSDCVWAGCNSAAVGSVRALQELQAETAAAPGSPPDRLGATDFGLVLASDPQAPISPGTPGIPRSSWLSSRGSPAPAAP